MEYKRYAPLIGKKLTWEIIDSLMKDMRAYVQVENLKVKKAGQGMRMKKTVAPHSEDDGA